MWINGQTCLSSAEWSLAGVALTNVNAARVEEALLVAMGNKFAVPVHVRLHKDARKTAKCWPLTALSLEAKKRCGIHEGKGG